MNDWVSPWDPERNLVFLKEVSSLLSQLGGPLTRELDGLLRKGEFKAIANFRFDYGANFQLRDYQCARSVHALVAKQEWMDIGIDTEAVAKRKFDDMEKHCEEFNSSIDARQLSADAWKVIHLSRMKIEHVLGRVPSLDRLNFSFGPGATTNVKGREANAKAKLSARLACSRELFPFVGDFLAEVPLWVWSKSGLPPLVQPLSEAESIRVLSEIETHAGSLTFVPKDARSKRSIIVEPIVNGFFQAGVGSYLKDRMKTCINLNLRDQTVNQQLAYEGSIHGGYATVDLSSASDCVTRSLVSLLLPWEWYEFLAKLVTAEIKTATGVRDLEKFSSMGNGFTFELESLLFWSIASSCVELLELPGQVSTFGDDIIVNSRSCSLLYTVLAELGFIVNDEKSFSVGPFRESCGADWFEGYSIRPFYAKKAMSEQYLYTFHNWAIRNCERELADLLFQYTDPNLHLFGPDGYGDGHLIGSYSLRQNRKMKRSGWEGGYFDTYSLNPKRLKKRRDSDWVFPSYSVYTRSGERDRTDPDIVRGSDGYAKVSIYTLATSVFGR